MEGRERVGRGTDALGRLCQIHDTRAVRQLVTVSNKPVVGGRGQEWKRARREQMNVRDFRNVNQGTKQS